MLSYAEVLVVAVLTFALVGYCLGDAIRSRRVLGAAGVWIVLLAAGLVVWPVGWVVSVLYLAGRRRRNATT